jgi:hypothetical protein
MNTRYADMVAPTGGYVYACRAGLDLGRRRGVAFGRAGRPDKTTAHPVPSRPVVEYQHARARRPPGNTARPRMAPPPAGMGTRRRRRARRLLALRQAHPTRTTVGPRTPHTTRARRHRRHRCTRAPATHRRLSRQPSGRPLRATTHREAVVTVTTDDTSGVRRHTRTQRADFFWRRAAAEWLTDSISLPTGRMITADRGVISAEVQDHRTRVGRS